MKLHHWIVSLMFAVPAVSSAKPPDLPMDLHVIFEETKGIGLNSDAGLAGHILQTDTEPLSRASRFARRPLEGSYNSVAAKASPAIERDRSHRRSNAAVPLLRRTNVRGLSNDFSEEQEPPLEPNSSRQIPRRMPTERPVKPTAEELQRTLDMFRSTQPLGAIPVDPF